MDKRYNGYETMSKEEFCEFVYKWAMNNYKSAIALDINISNMHVQLVPKFVDCEFEIDVSASKVK